MKSNFSVLMRKVSRRNDLSAIVSTVLLFLLFGIFSDGFLSQYNMFNVSRTAAIYLFIALGQVFVVIIGGMNLSLGNIGALSVVAFGYSCEILHLNGFVSTVIALLVGALCGLFNGFIIIKLNLSSFIVTLSTSFIFAGLVTGISKGSPYTNIPEKYSVLGRAGFLGLPILFWLMLLVVIILWFFFKYTVMGRQLLATGGNETAARLSGIKTERMLFLANVLSGLFAAVAGCFWVSRMSTASPATGGDWMMISFAVAAIGGTVLSGGEVSPVGLFFASFLMAMIKNGLVMLNVDMYYEQSFLGLIILIAVCFETIRLRYNKKKR